MSEPLFTFITFVAKHDTHRGSGLKLTGKSLLQQFDAPPFEWIIIDAAPCDATADLIREWDRDFIRYVAQPVSGMSHAHNRGIDMATGKYIWFLPSGDCLSDLYVLRDLERELRMHPNSDLLYGDARDNGIIHKARDFESLMHRPIIAFQAMLFRRAQIGNTRWNEELYYSADYDFVLHAQDKMHNIHPVQRLLCDIDSTQHEHEQQALSLKEQHAIRAHILRMPPWKNMLLYYRDILRLRFFKK